MSKSRREVMQDVWNGYDADFVPYDDIFDTDTLMDFLKAQAILHPEDHDCDAILESIEELRRITDDFKNNHQNKDTYFTAIDNFIDTYLPQVDMLIEPVEAYADVILRLKDIANKL